jgi:hypothetical protein
MMTVCNFNSLNNDLMKLLNTALVDGAVIRDYKGHDFTIIPIRKPPVGKSPFEDVPCLNLDISTQDIIDAVKASRAGEEQMPQLLAGKH